MILQAQYSQHGNPAEVLELIEKPQPELQEHQALIEVLASPINPADLLTVQGLYGILPDLPATPGGEGIGRIHSVGSKVENVKTGQNVLLPRGFGAWQSHLVADAQYLTALPEGGDPVQLSMMIVNPATALLMLEAFVDLKEGDWIIQDAANSGVGTYLIQLAKLKGLKTVNVVRRPELVDSLKELGGDVVLVDGESLVKEVQEATGGAHIRLGIDSVGGETTQRIADSLGQGATLLSFGSMSLEPYHLSPQSIVFKDITFKGFWLSKFLKESKPEEVQALYARITGMILKKEIEGEVDTVYPLSKIKEAVAHSAQGKRSGKIIIAPNVA